MEENQKYQNKKQRLQFEVYKAHLTEDGTLKKIRVIGLAFLREGKHAYQIKLFTLLNDRYYVEPKEDDPGTYRVMTRDQSTNRRGTRVYWSEVGEGKILSALGVVEIKIDLLSESIYLSIFPKAAPASAYPPKYSALKLVS